MAVQKNYKMALDQYECHMREEEKGRATIEKYLRDVKVFLKYAGQNEVTKRLILRYKEYLQDNYAVSSVNSMLAALNHYLRFCGKEECRVKHIKMQRMTYCDTRTEITKEDYSRLVRTAEKKGKEQLSLIIQTICSTGIRISELEYITAEAITVGFTDVNCKGKNRRIYLPHKLRMRLQTYCRKNKIRSGSIFLTSHGNKVHRSSIWRAMKQLCEDANVEESKVFPHNLRHLYVKHTAKIYLCKSRNPKLPISI